MFKPQHLAKTRTLLLLAIGLSRGIVWADYYSGYNYRSYAPERAPIISLELNPQASLNSAMRVAAREDRLDEVIDFLKEGANVNSSSETGETALMYASRNCSEEIVRALIKAHANENLQDSTGKTALMYASADSCLPVVKVLVRVKGVDISTRDREGQSALDYARSSEVLEVGGPGEKIVKILGRQ